jgi:DNA-binding transcriptional MerR regulator
MPLTVAEIADREGKRGAAKEAFIQRLRHWTRERLLFPLGETNPGTGKHRLYDDAVVYETRFLDAMTNLGISIATQRLIIGTIRQERHLGRRVKEAEKSGAQFWLVIETLGNHSNPYFSDDLEKDLKNRVTDSILLFDLIRFFRQSTGEKSG